MGDLAPALSSWGLLPVALVCAATVLGGMYGLRLSRTTSDFYVASRVISPGWNASAISGEYISAASFLGVAGLVYSHGVEMLWLPVGYTVGFLVVLTLVAAPLRRSGAYTAPDFAEARLDSRGVRHLAGALAVAIGWLYLLPQLYGAGLALAALTGAPVWVGAIVVSVVVTLNVVAGGMRSVTLVQAVQYWFKLVAIGVPAVLLVWFLWRSGTPVPALTADVAQAGRPSTTTVYSTISMMIALALGTMGLPHVVVRFYTNPDGRAARRTTVAVIALLGLFYLFPPVYAVLGRMVLAPGSDVTPDTIVLLLPGLIAPEPLATVLTGLLAAGAFAAFLSTSSGLVVALTGVLDQDLVRPRLHALTGGDIDGVHSFRLAALFAALVPCAAIPFVGDIGLAATVTLAFAVAASTFCPLLLLGVWWRGLSVPGAAAGMACGGALSLGATAVSMAGLAPPGWMATALAAPAAWTVPIAFVVTALVSLATPDHIPASTLATMVRLHTPESLDVRRRS